MSRCLLTIMCLWMAGLSACQPQDTTSSHQAEVDAIFDQWNQQETLGVATPGVSTPGCALAVIQEGELVYTKGYGMADMEHGIPITPQSIFYIGSVSKQFVATALLLLEEEGKLSLDDDVRKYIPELPDYSHPIHIQHLVHHTSGLRDNLTLWELSGRSMIDDIPEEEIFDLICRQDGLNFVPGEAYAYSNTCYFLMSMIIEKISGQSLRDFAQDRIFSPLGMQHSQFNDDNRRIISNRAFGYTQLSEDSIGNLIMRFDLVGSGGLYSSVEDLYLWDQNFYHNQLGKRGQALIEKLQTNGKFNNGEEVDYAYAMINGSYRGLKTIHHTGSMGGYRAVYVRFPDEQFSVIILGNMDSFDPLARAYEVASVYLKDKLKAEEPAKASSPDDIQEGPQAISEERMSDASKFVGTYYSPELSSTYQLEFSEDKESLVLHTPDRRKISLVISEPNLLSDNTYVLSFNDNFQTFNMNYAGTRGIIFKKLLMTL